MILEEPPRSSEDLNNMIGVFVTNNIKFDKNHAKKVCEQLYGDLKSKNLIDLEGSLTWVAEKLDAPLTMMNVELITEAEYSFGYTQTPFSFERYNYDNNQFIDGEALDAKMKEKQEEKRRKEGDKNKASQRKVHEGHMKKMTDMKNTLPACEILHNKGARASSDIRIDQLV